MFSGRSEEKQRQNEQMNRSSCLERAIDTFMQAATYKSFSDFVALAAEIWSVGHGQSDEAIAAIREFRARRNLLLHERSRVNETYLTSVGEQPKPPSIGQFLEMDRDYVCHRLSAVSALLDGFLQALRKKYRKYTKIRAAKELWAHLFTSPVMPFNDFWHVDEKADHIFALKRGKYEKVLSHSEKLILGLWRAHFNGNGEYLTKLAQLVNEEEAELAGLLAPKPLRDAAQKTLAEHLKDYVADLSAQGRSKKHVAVARNRVQRLCQQCGWVKPCDVTSDGFNSWRAKQKLALKTCNEYLGLASAFLNWLERNQRIALNPLRRVTKAETRGREKRKRRALTQAEIELLVSRSGKNGLAYFLAAYTGLRRGEMKQLMWSDVHLDAPKPFIEVRASTTKNHKIALIPLVQALADALRARRAKRAEAFPKVFRNGVPTPETLRADLKACGIAYRDDLGRVVDFHALRYTFATMLARAGIPPRVAMELMRHSDMRLTQSTYTDATLLPLFNEVAKLPSLACSLGRSQNSAKTGQNEGKPVQSDQAHTSGKIVAISERGTHLAKAVPSWENVELAERVGFEPTVPLPVRLISSQVR